MSWKIFLVLLIFLATFQYTFALDDSTRQNITIAAKNYIGTQADPIFVTEEGVVGFQGNISTINVIVDLTTFDVIGYNNYNNLGNGTEIYTEQQCRALADSVFNGLTVSYKNEYQFSSSSRVNTKGYDFVWQRYVNGTPVLGDIFKIRVDYASLKMIEWSITYDPYFSPDIQPPPQTPPSPPSAPSPTTGVSAGQAASIAGSFGTVIGTPKPGTDGKSWIVNVEKNGTTKTYTIDTETGRASEMAQGSRQTSQPSEAGISPGMIYLIGIILLILFFIILVAWRKEYKDKYVRGKKKK